MYIRRGIFCRHAFLALNHGGVKKLPRDSVMIRWMKNAEKMASELIASQVLEYCKVIESTKSCISDLWFEFNSCVTIAGLNKDRIDLIKKQLQEMKSLLLEGEENQGMQSKRDVIESLIGSQSNASENISVKPPQISRNKGCGKRIKSSVESTLHIPKRRKCKICGEIAGHNARTCPSKDS